MSVKYKTRLQTRENSKIIKYTKWEAAKKTMENPKRILEIVSNCLTNSNSSDGENI